MLVKSSFFREIKLVVICLGLHDVFPGEFEKDNAKNSHIDFISCAAVSYNCYSQYMSHTLFFVLSQNLRAKVYGIEQVDQVTVKRIAGKIVPAIATTTAAVAGLVSCLVLFHLFKINCSAHQVFLC